MKRTLLLNLAFVTASAASVSALTIDDAIRSLGPTTLSISATTLQLKAGIDDLRAEASLPGAEVEFSYQWGAGMVGNKLNAGISQSFDWPGVYAARHKAVKESESMLAALERSARIEFAADMREMMVQYISARRSLEAMLATGKTLERMEQAVNRAYAGGETTILDVNKMKIARAEMDHMIHIARTRLDELNGQISEKAQTDCSKLLDELDDTYPAMEIPDEATYMDGISRYDTEMLAATSDARMNRHIATAERRTLLPGFSAGYTYSREEGETWNGLTLGVTLPSRASARRASAAKLRAEAAEETSLGVMEIRKAQYAAMTATASRLKTELGRLGPVFDKTDNLKLLEKAYNGGEMSLVDFLNEVKYFSDARMSYLDDVAEYHLTLSRLNRYNF